MPDTFVPNSSLDTLTKGARNGDAAAMQQGAIRAKEDLNDLMDGVDADDLVEVLEAIGKLGLDLGKVFAKIAPYVSAAQAGIGFVNSVAELAGNIALKEDETVTHSFHVPDSGENHASSVKLTVRIDKESKGWVIGDNFEYVPELEVEVEELNGQQLLGAHLTLAVTAIGFGQDDIVMPVKFVSGDGSGPPAVVQVRKAVDRFGLEAEQVLGLHRTGLTKAKFGITDRGTVEYGVNGANVMISAKVSGIVQPLVGPAFGLTPAMALDLGLSI